MARKGHSTTNLQSVALSQGKSQLGDVVAFDPVPAA